MTGNKEGKRMRLIAGIGWMAEEALDKLLDNQQIEGIIFGDYFCNRKMYKSGMTDLISYAEKTVQKGKDIYYQTPVYITSRNFSYVLDIAEMLRRICDRVGKSIKILVQDVGMVRILKEEMAESELIWGQFGRNRENTITKTFLKFLKDIDVSGAVVTEIGRSIVYREMGLKVYGIYGTYHCQTFGRTCYNMDQIDEELVKCDRQCWDGWYLKQENQEYRLTIDGYVLGESYDYCLGRYGTRDIMEKTQDCLICARDIEQWNEYFKAWKEME